MKRRLFSIFLATLAVGLIGSCAKINEQIADLDKRVETIETQNRVSINTQIESINSSIADLGQIRKDIQDLIGTNTSQNADIKALQTADENIGKRIDELKAYVGDLSRFAEENWVKNTFATIDELNKTAKELDDLAKTVDGISKNLENLGKTVDGLGKSLEELSGKLTKDIKDANDKLAAQIKSLEDRVSALEQMIQTVTIVPAYTDGSVEAVDDVLTIDCVVEPAAALETLTEKNIFILSSTAKTKAVSIDTIKVAKFGKDIEKGIITIKADASEAAPASGEALVVAVKIVNGISQYTTEFAPVVAVSTGLPKGSLGGEFSVSSTKKVHFSKSNLYYDGAAFQFEANQFDYVKAWDKSHVGLFYWSKDAAAATAANYSDPQASAGDVLFTNAADFTINNAVEGFRTLTKQEWIYLTEDRNNAELLCKAGVTVCGNKNCMVIAPDDFKGTISESYNSDEWFMAEEAGLVCLPATGIRSGSALAGAEDINTYWTATPTGDGAAGNVVFEAEAEPETKALACAANGKGIADLEINDFNEAPRFATLGNANPSIDLKFGNQNAQQSKVSTNGKQQDEPQILVGKKVRANHNGNSKATPAKAITDTAPKTAGADINVTATSVYFSNYYGYYDYYMYVDGGAYDFSGIEPVEGKTYTLDDMDADYTGWYSNEDGGYITTKATAATLTVSKKNGLPYVVGTMTLGGNNYTITYELKLTDTVTVNANNLTAKTHFYGGYEYTFNDANWTFDIVDFDMAAKTGTLQNVDFDYSCVYPTGGSSYDAYYFAAVVEDVVVAQDADTLKLTGAIAAENGILYVLDARYEKPDTKEITLVADTLTFNTKLTAGFYTVSGFNVDRTYEFFFYFKSKSITGNFTEEDMDAYSTWVDEKDGKKTLVSYQNLSAANIQVTLVNDMVYYTGTITLATNKGQEAIITLNLSCPYKQEWGEWADFAPFDLNTGKYAFNSFFTATQYQNKIPVQERKDNTGLKQYKLEGWGKGLLSATGTTLIINRDADNKLTIPAVNTGASTGGYAVWTGDAYTLTGGQIPQGTYDPETGTFSMQMISFLPDYDFYNWGASLETLTMDKPILERDTVKVNLNSITIEEDVNSATGAHRGWLFEGQDTDVLYLIQVLGKEKYGTFSYADGTLGQNFYNIIPSSGQGRCQFIEGTVTITEDQEGIKLTGLFVGEDEKAYVFNWFRKAGLLDYDTNAPFDAEFVIANYASIYLENGEIYISATNAENLTMGLVLFTDPSATEIPAGTYVISDSEEAGTALKSIGVYGGYLTECFAGVRTAQGISDCWFLVEGTVTITYDENGEMSVEVDAKNSWEQNVTARFVPGLSRNYALPIRLVSEVVE